MTNNNRGVCDVSSQSLMTVLAMTALGCLLLKPCHKGHRKCNDVSVRARQMRVVCGRTVRNILRNPQTSYAQLALQIFFAILVGLIYYQMPLTLPEALQNR